MTTNWKRNTWKESDRWFLTDDLWNVLADNTWNKILFHTWIFVKRKTKWKNAR